MRTNVYQLLAREFLRQQVLQYKKSDRQKRKEIRLWALSYHDPMDFCAWVLGVPVKKLRDDFLKTISRIGK